MKTARERAQETFLKFQELLPKNYPYVIGNTIMHEIEMALKEQDKLTRHAIAEKLLSKSSPIKAASGMMDVIEANEAENIAMNTSAL